MAGIKARAHAMLGAAAALISLIGRGISFARRNGLRAFGTALRNRLQSSRVRPVKPSPEGKNIFEQAYVTAFEAASSNQGNPEYVPLTASDFPSEESLVKLVAFYLPQFHPIPENDEWWGRGFTEWTNVSKAVPQFLGHYQPHLPGELGFYDLRVTEVQKRQVELARLHGIHGFAFYYYWFHGKRLLEKPIDQFFKNKELDFPFCIFWANENWTRRWDGKEEDVLIRQEHSPQGDLDFIREVALYFRDERYIRIDGKPVLLVYRVELLPNPLESVEIWRDYCRHSGIGEIYLIAGQVYGFEDPRSAGFDGAVEFPPHNSRINQINDQVEMLNPDHQGQILHYRDFAEFYWKKSTEPPYDLYRTVSPGWDNEPRKPGRGYSLAFSTPLVYQQWLMEVCTAALKKGPGKRFVFINAWNEWAEGAYLEPDRKFGYAYLQATLQALQAIRKSAE